MTEDLWKGACEMTEKEPTGKVEVAHITGIQGIRAAMEVLEREATQEGEADVPLPGATPEDVPLGRRTCSVCAARQRRLSRGVLELRRLAPSRAVGGRVRRKEAESRTILST